MGRNCVLSNAKPIGVVAAISSGIQGLVWASFYLVVLLQRYCVFSVGNNQSQTFKQYLAAYITAERCPGTNGVLACVSLTGPEMLLPWLVIGVFGNLILAASSLALVLVLVKCSKETHFAFINTWIFFGLLTFAVDAGLTFLFSVDFMKLQSSTCLGDRGLAAIAVASLLLISTHGVLLTIANLAFIIFFFAVSVKLYIKYKIRNKEIDLVADWPSASSENSLFDFYNNKTKSDVVGIVNPIQEYPEYSAKGRWPTLRETAEQNRPPLRAWESRADLEDQRREHSAIVNNNNIINQQMGSVRMRKYIQIEPGTGTNRTVYNQPEVAGSFGKVGKSEYSTPSVSSLPSRNREIGLRRNLPSTFAPITPPTPTTPPAPPLPPVNPKLKIATIPKFEASTKFSSSNEDAVKVAAAIEPDYTPPAVRKPFETVSGAPSGGLRQQKSAAMMSLHEAIKSRPPLKPVFSRMKSTDC